jgi:hypothetical protein
MIKAVEDKNIEALRSLLENGKHPESETDSVRKRVATTQNFIIIALFIQ